jgi:hypothetical protein
MIYKINAQLDSIEKCIQWIKSTESMNGTKGDLAYKNLVSLRRLLNKKKFALEGNPAAAIYGASQMGKSYLASSLLSLQGKPLSIIDGKHYSYDFINEINPEGQGVESTSLVTRFSANYEWKNPSYPVKAKLLSPIDLVLVLCDSYFNDVKARIETAVPTNELNDKVIELIQDYKKLPDVQTLIIEDDVLNMLDYFNDNFSTKAASVIQSNFFDDISKIIQKVPWKEWPDIFQLLWNGNDRFTKLLVELLDNYNKLSFSSELYLPMNAVLREHGTILDVMRLHELYGNNHAKLEKQEQNTSVLIYENNTEKIIQAYSKSYLCALIAEVVFQLPSELNREKPFLNNTDLLDFPGARNRLGIPEDKLVDADTPNLLLRGKVAYLFTKYSSSEKINILLFCQNQKNSEVQTVFPELFNNWIETMIGKNKDEREDFIRKSIVPPFFVVCTMFNVDLKYDSTLDAKDKIDSKKMRWNKRFITVLKEVFGNKKWMKEWTNSQNNFQNIYLLRDFKYSTDDECKLFRGYENEKIEKEEIIRSEYPDFKSDLMKSFVEFDFVKEHFANPEVSWKAASEINQDGTDLIISQLTISASNINIAREAKIIEEFTRINQQVLVELRKHYHDNNADSRLIKAKEIAGKIQLRLALSFGKDTYFFGPFINSLMLSNTQVYSLYLDKIRNIGRRVIDNPDKYVGIRLQVPELNAKESYEKNVDYLRKRFDLKGLDDKKVQDFFESKDGDYQIDLNELFFSNNQSAKNLSDVLAESLEQYWLLHHLPLQKPFLTQFLSDLDIDEIYSMFQLLYTKLNMNRLIAKSISNHIDSDVNTDEYYEMIADISVEILNKFVNTVGFEFLSTDELNSLQESNIKNDLGLTLNHASLEHAQANREGAANLISIMGDLPKLLNQTPLPLDAQRLPNYKNFIVWKDLLKSGFLTVCDIPTYDVHANSHLKLLIDLNENIIKS